MSDNFQFDQFVKEQLSNFHAEVPDQMWNNIVTARRNSRPKGFWLFGRLGKVVLSAAIILTTSIAGYLLRDRLAAYIGNKGY